MKSETLKQMKKLFITRHAKSSWEDITVSDHDHDLLEVGIRRTRKVAEYIKKKGEIPDIIISSSAVRALKTARIFAEIFNYPVENIKISPSLYGCDEDDILDEIYGLPDETESAMVVGHNPAFTDFANYFMKPKQQIDNLPTSGIVAIRFKTDKWTDIHLAKHKMLFKAFPKDL